MLNLPQTTQLLQALIYKELYGCKWDPMTLTKNISYTPAFKFYKYFGLKMACIGRN